MSVRSEFSRGGEDHCRGGRWLVSSVKLSIYRQVYNEYSKNSSQNGYLLGTEQYQNRVIVSVLRTLYGILCRIL